MVSVLELNNLTMAHYQRVRFSFKLLTGPYDVKVSRFRDPIALRVEKLLAELWVPIKEQKEEEASQKCQERNDQDSLGA